MSIKRDILFSGAHLSIVDMVKIKYFLAYKYTQDIIILESGISNKTVVQYSHFCLEVSIDVLEQLSELIDGRKDHS